MFFARDDYKEFLNLAILLLKGNPGDSVQYTFLTCGAMHKARWMSKVIYAMKIVLYYREMITKDINIFEDDQYLKLTRFVKFVLFVYVDYWFETPLPSKAPTSDLQLVKNCIRYRVVDEEGCF